MIEGLYHTTREREVMLIVKITKCFDPNPRVLISDDDQRTRAALLYMLYHGDGKGGK